MSGATVNPIGFSNIVVKVLLEEARQKALIPLEITVLPGLKSITPEETLRLKKCQRCGTISQDADVVCGICGTNIANTPSLEGSIEDEILKDQQLREEESRRIRQKIPRESRRELMRGLFPSLLAVTIGFTLLLYGLLQALAMGNSDFYFGPSYSQTLTLSIDILNSIGGSAFIIAGFNFGIKGLTSGASPTERGRGAANATTSYGLSTISNLSMTAAYKGQFLPKEQQGENKLSD